LIASLLVLTAKILVPLMLNISANEKFISVVSVNMVSGQLLKKILIDYSDTSIQHFHKNYIQHYIVYYNKEIVSNRIILMWV